jgi:hypothetical protein
MIANTLQTRDLSYCRRCQLTQSRVHQPFRTQERSNVPHKSQSGK